MRQELESRLYGGCWNCLLSQRFELLPRRLHLSLGVIPCRLMSIQHEYARTTSSLWSRHSVVTSHCLSALPGHFSTCGLRLRLLSMILGPDSLNDREIEMAEQ